MFVLVCAAAAPLPTTPPPTKSNPPTTPTRQNSPYNYDMTSHAKTCDDAANQACPTCTLWTKYRVAPNNACLTAQKAKCTNEKLYVSAAGSYRTPLAHSTCVHKHPHHPLKPNPPRTSGSPPPPTTTYTPTRHQYIGPGSPGAAYLALPSIPTRGIEDVYNNKNGVRKQGKHIWQNAWTDAIHKAGGANGKSGFTSSNAGALVVNTPAYRSKHQMWVLFWLPKLSCLFCFAPLGWTLTEGGVLIVLSWLHPSPLPTYLGTRAHRQTPTCTPPLHQPHRRHIHVGDLDTSSANNRFYKNCLPLLAKAGTTAASAKPIRCDVTGFRNQGGTFVPFATPADFLAVTTTDLSTVWQHYLDLVKNHPARTQWTDWENHVGVLVTEVPNKRGTYVVALYSGPGEYVGDYSFLK
jgi:hypothetical protein